MNKVSRIVCTFLLFFSVFLIGITNPASAISIEHKGAEKIAKTIVKESPKIAKTAVKIAPKAIGTASQVGVVVNATSSAYDLYQIKKDYDRHKDNRKNQKNWF